jgi:tRNA-dihydrouridine synthase B
LTTGQYTAYMKIGNLTVDGPFVLAPLAGLTDAPMRKICRRLGAAMVWTEMVSAEGLTRDGGKSLELLSFDQEERPIAGQIFGARPEAMAEAARRVGDVGADVVDINVGCPARKVVKAGSGAALMRAPELLREIALAVVEASDRPVTAKIRSGWDEHSVNALEIAAMLEECGVSAVAIHPRTRAQGFKGAADWSLIARVADGISIPVLGSGDVGTAEDAVRMLETTGCDAVMVGRAAVGRPWIFRRAELLRSTGDAGASPSLQDALAVAIDHLDLMVEAKGERRGVVEMRKHLVAYLRGFPGASSLRSEIVRIEGHAAVRARLSATAQVARGGVDDREGGAGGPDQRVA